MKLAFDLDVPDGAIDQNLEAELIQAAREQAVLYSGQRITTGEAARSLGLTRIQFLHLLRERGVPFLEQLDEQDFRIAKQFAVASGGVADERGRGGAAGPVAVLVGTTALEQDWLLAKLEQRFGYGWRSWRGGSIAA